jgi:hypothetical protein
MFRLYWFIIRPSKEQIQCIKLYSAFWDPKRAFGIPECTINVDTLYVLWKAWWWLNRVETCCHKNILCNKLLCLTEIYTLYELDKHIGMTNVKFEYLVGILCTWSSASGPTCGHLQAIEIIQECELNFSYIYSCFGEWELSLHNEYTV